MLTYIFILSALIWGVAALFDDGMIFSKLGDWLNNQLPEVILKPLIFCPPCMASIWGTVASSYLYATGRFTTLEQWLVLCVGTCGLNYIIARWLSK